MADLLAFVQFPHPGREHGPDPGGTLKHWEHGEHEHRRKFMRGGGQWLTSPTDPPQVGGLVFWGEWEAASRVAVAPSRVPGGPSWIHTPFFNGREDAPDGVVAQNTDPFVFGDQFLYTLCRQPRNRRLRELAPGSLILFGSKSEGAFVLDTVFIVADYVDHTRATYEHTLVRRVSDVYRAATLEPMYAWQGVAGGRLYFGANADQRVEGMFSFVPCLPADAGRAFARPRIELDGLIRPNLAMRARTCAVRDLGELRAIWDRVVDQVLEQGLVLGVHLALPVATD
jgi:hypothetical protein